MPILKNAKKALRASQRKNEINRRVRSRTKTALDVLKATPSAENIKTVFSVIDKSVKRKIFHRNKAARLKSQMSKLVS
jgi:small subunit ribosomal protein S20